jgi:prepilin-type N-terminal cleavage/methylation domain-containing protein
MTTKKAFTLIEIMVALAIVAVLATGITYIGRRGSKEKANLVRSQSEMITIANAIKLNVQEFNVYPDDVNRALPAGIEQYIATPNDEWPNAPWPGSVYDYENWDGGEVIQISARFCVSGQDSVCKAAAEKYLQGKVPAATLNNWDSLSSVYYCIKESSTDAAKKCRSHSSRPVNHPGYRIDISTAK